MDHTTPIVVVKPPKRHTPKRVTKTCYLSEADAAELETMAAALEVKPKPSDHIGSRRFFVAHTIL